ncbi:MAG: hypothetical protein KF752_04710 [Pirellulaceae bacterium]|nr:hypothetical protein [Pirellulaceae bacterium]
MSQDSVESTQDPVQPPTVSSPIVDFGKDIAPLLVKNCVACHNEKKAEGGLNLQSHDTLMKGGDSGAAVTAGDLSNSQLVSRLVDPDSPMPPDDNSVGAQRFTEAEVTLVRSWIESGAAPPQQMQTADLKWQPIPATVHPVNALAASTDGNYVALGRGNQAFVLRQVAASSLEHAFALVDPAVAGTLHANYSNSSSAKAATIASQISPAAHLDLVQSVAFSPDSERIATGGYRSVKIWRRNLQPIGQLPTGVNLTLEKSVTAISPSGRWLALATPENPLEVVDLQAAQSQRFLRALPESVSALVWLDDERLVACDTAGTYALFQTGWTKWQVLTSQTSPAATELTRLGNEKLLGIASEGRLLQLSIDSAALTVAGQYVDGFDQVQSLAASANYELPMAVGLASGIVRIVQTSDYAVLREITTAGPVQRLAMGPDGATVASSTGQAPAQLWRVQDGTPVATLDRDYQFSQLVAVAQRNQTRQQGLLERLNNQLGELKKATEAEQASLAKVQEVREQAAQELAAKEAEQQAADQAVQAGMQAVTEAEQALAEAMKLLETRKTELETKHKAVAEANAKRQAALSALASRDQALATAQDAASRAAARVPEIEGIIHAEQQRLEGLQQASQSLAADPAAKHQAVRLAFDTDGSRVVVADEKGFLHFYSTVDGNTEAKLKVPAAVVHMATTTAGNLVSLTGGGVVQQWQLDLPWQLERTIGDSTSDLLSDRISALDFSPDGGSLAIGSGPASRFGEVKIVDCQTGEVSRDLGQIHSDSVLALRYSPNGRQLASGGADKICRVVDLETGQVVRTLEGHTHHVLTLAWKDDGVTLATGSADQSVKLWNIETGTQIRTIGGFKKEVTAVVFVGQTHQLAAVDASGVVQLLDANSGKQIRAFPGADGPVLALGVGADGKVLYAGGWSGNYWIWQIEDAKRLN